MAEVEELRAQLAKFAEVINEQQKKKMKDEVVRRSRKSVSGTSWALR